MLILISQTFVICRWGLLFRPTVRRVRLANIPVSGFLPAVILGGDTALPGDAALLTVRRCTDGRNDIDAKRLLVGDIARLTGSERDIRKHSDSLLLPRDFP